MERADHAGSGFGESCKDADWDQTPLGGQLRVSGSEAQGVATRKNGVANEADAGESQADDDRPKDNGGASTAQWLFDQANQLAIRACGHPITVDTCAAPWNAKCERFFTEEQDGLKQPWDAKAVWCNSPFSATVIEMFVRKAIEAARQGTTSVLLVPRWNYPYLDLCERHGRIHRICSPVSFQRQDGSTFAMNNRYSTTQLVVVMFGPTIQPGFGTPIRNGGPTSDDIVAEDEGMETQQGITARAIAGDGDNRRENDAYYTPEEAIEALLAVEEFEGLTSDPADGDGRVVRALQRVGCEAIGNDVARGTDFLKTVLEVDNVVTNPPWSLKTEFIRHAKKCARHKVALLLPLSALAGVARRPLFEDAEFPLRTVYIFERRINFDPEAQGGTTLTTGWFVWERGYRGEPVLRWLST